MTLTELFSRARFKLGLYGPVNSLRFFIIYVYRLLFYQFLRKSYSQFGEDLIIAEIFRKSADLYFLDIGANKPTKFNNTYHFYLHGSHGINVEPNPYLIKEFENIRPRDINLNLGVSDSNSKLTFYQLDPDVNSTFSQKEADIYLKTGSVLISKTKVEVITMDHLLKNFSPHRSPDFISLDTEGYDLKILKSNNWNTFRPKVICVETVHDPNIQNYLTKLNYKIHYKTALNTIFVDNEKLS